MSNIHLFHEWSPNWHKYRCSYVKYCLIDGCNAEKRKPINHDWGPWIAIGSCKYESRCYVCREKQYHQKHKFGDWYHDKKECEWARLCSKCKKKQQGDAKHSYTDWKQDPEKCKLVRICTCCKKKEFGNTKHHWSKWELNISHPCTVKRLCKVCNEEETITNHSLNEWIYIADKCVKVAFCQRLVLIT